LPALIHLNSMAAVNEIPKEYHSATQQEYDDFIAFCDSNEGWNVAHQSSDGKIKVWDKTLPNSPINCVKLFAVFPDIDASTMYDVLHDPDYRKVWDENMIDGPCLEQIDECNDVGYYSAKSPVMLVSPRDFVNQRSWREKEDELLIMNHSVVLSSMPEKSNFVRANSIKTGYLVRVRKEGGCNVIYITQTDPRGSIPNWVTNKVTKHFAPTIIGKLEAAAHKYNDWKKDHNPDHKPWRKKPDNNNS